VKQLDILSSPQRDLLTQFACSNMALVLDYDGTLAPIVEDPARAVMRGRTRALLTRAARLYPTAVISGRAHVDVSPFLRGISLACIVGSHGADWGTREPGDREIERLVTEWKRLLGKRLRGMPGVMLEDKRWSLAVHYRLSRRKREARAAIADCVGAISQARVVLGKQVVNLVPEGAPHKGIALRRVRAQLGCDTAVYVGDDATDEDVFALDEPGQLLGIRVGSHRDTHATHYLRRQRDIDRLLALLIGQRPAVRAKRSARRAA
jgi:trehalose 6-phosphate phosphatase